MTSPAKRAPAAARAPGRRRRILDVAMDHFTRFGFRRTSIEDLAREVGCAKGAVYLEFESKEALLSAVVSEILEGSRARFTREVATIASPLERLHATLLFAYREMEREPLFERLVAEDPELTALKPLAEREDQAREADAQLATLRAWLEEGIRQGEIREDVDLDVVPFVVSALRFLHYHTRAATGGRLPRERLLRGVVDLFIAGLAAPAPLPAAPRADRPPRKR